MLNNLGGLTQLEINLLCKEIVDWFGKKKFIRENDKSTYLFVLTHRKQKYRREKILFRNIYDIVGNARIFDISLENCRKRLVQIFR